METWLITGIMVMAISAFAACDLKTIPTPSYSDVNLPITSMTQVSFSMGKFLVSFGVAISICVLLDLWPLWTIIITAFCFVALLLGGNNVMGGWVGR